MTEHNTESRAEQGTDSPELGFSFGVMSAGVVAERLCEGLVSKEDVETDDLSLEIRALSELFTQGLDDSVWRSYVRLFELRLAYIDVGNNERIAERNQALLEELADVAGAHIVGQVDYVNTLLKNMPELVQKSETDTRTLRNISIEWYDFSDTHPPKQLPVNFVSHWSDEESELHDSTSDVYINTDKLPNAAKQELKAYHETYEV